jgi:phage/plasmid-associated DNA primase
MIEESFWSGSPRDAAKIKTLITEPTIVVERKGKDAFQFDSYHRFIMCTNNQWAVPQTRDERRFFVLEVSDQKKQDREYFNGLYKSMNSPEVLGQFFNFLRNYDITSYNLYKAPKTEATHQQLLESLKSEETWLMGLLEEERLDGRINSYDLVQDRVIPKQEFFDSYIHFCKQMGITGFGRCNAIQLGKFLKKVIDVKDGGKVTVAGHRQNCYQLPALKEMKSMFNDYYSCF